MIVIMGDRRSGKTETLLSLSQFTGIPICAPNNHMAKFIELEAREKGFDIPKPVSYMIDVSARGCIGCRDVLFDELGMALERDYGMKVLFATVNAEPVELAGMSLIEVIRAWFKARKVER